MDLLCSQLGDRIQCLSHPVCKFTTGYYRRITMTSVVFHMSVERILRYRSNVQYIGLLHYRPALPLRRAGMGKFKLDFSHSWGNCE